MTTFFVATASFLLLHQLVERPLARRGVPFHVALKVSRGLASVLLVVLGFATLIGYWPRWRVLFLGAHPDGSIPYHLLLFIVGHFAADLLWLAWGRLGRGSRPRVDLVLHHLVGLAACGAALWLELGYLLVAIAMTTELMPVATGLGGWGKVLDSLGVERAAVALSLAALGLWRIPFWAFLVAMVASGRVAAALPDLPPPVGPIVLAAASALVLMDFYWAHKLWSTYREMTAEHAHRRAARRAAVI